MINLVTIKQAAIHLNLDIDEVTQIHIPDLELKLQLATKSTFDYHKIIVPEYTSPEEESAIYDYYAANPSAIPLHLKQTCLLILGALWKDRESDTADIISEQFRRLGRMNRYPSMA